MCTVIVKPKQLFTKRKLGHSVGMGWRDPRASCPSARHRSSASRQGNVSAPDVNAGALPMMQEFKRVIAEKIRSGKT
jgi:hypothetical protein